MDGQSPGQLLVIGVPGTSLDTETAALLRALQPGGFILFGRNIKSASQLRTLTDDLRSLCKVEPIITIDQEGGRVSRLRLIGNEPPSARQLCLRGDADLIRRHGELTGRLLRLFGFNLDLCPVLDIGYDDEADNSLRGRTYGRNPDETISHAACFNETLRAEGILSCGKHFPGYTFAAVDPHHDLPVVRRSREEMEAAELRVFRAFSQSVDSMMIGHANYPALDNSGLPASLSSAIVSDLLRGELGYEGLVMTDDLDMGAILNGYGMEEAVRLCVHAGNDIVLICHRLEAAKQARAVLDSLPAADLDPALARIAATKAKLTPPDAFSEGKFWRLDKDVWDLRVATLGEEQAAKRSPEDGKRSPVETY